MSNPNHDPRTGKFTFAPGGVEVDKELVRSLQGKAKKDYEASRGKSFAEGGKTYGEAEASLEMGKHLRVMVMPVNANSRGSRRGSGLRMHYLIGGTRVKITK